MKYLSITVLSFLALSFANAQECTIPDVSLERPKDIYANYDCINLLDSTSVDVQETGSGSFAIRKVVKVLTPAGAA